MEQATIIQGRCVTPDDVTFISRLIADNPDWTRMRLSHELCALWSWQNAKGRMKDMACRTLLLKLHRAGRITLPPPRTSCPNRRRNYSIEMPEAPAESIESPLCERMPVDVSLVKGAKQDRLFAGFLAHHHYLGYRGHVGENMKYLVFDRERHALGCVLFGSAAWKTAPRDAFIGWDVRTRKQRLHLVTNNMRFLILPWVKIPHLASHILGRVARRISADWVEKYGRPIHLLETFVECDRFRGTCYRAANWIHVGQTQGRGKLDRKHRCDRPVKDIYVYPLSKRFREALCDAD